MRYIYFEIHQLSNGDGWIPNTREIKNMNVLSLRPELNSTGYFGSTSATKRIKSDKIEYLYIDQIWIDMDVYDIDTNNIFKKQDIVYVIEKLKIEYEKLYTITNTKNEIVDFGLQIPKHWGSIRCKISWNIDRKNNITTLLSELTDEHLMNCLGYVRVHAKKTMVADTDGNNYSAEHMLIHEFNYRIKKYKGDLTLGEIQHEIMSDFNNVSIEDGVLVVIDEWEYNGCKNDDDCSDRAREMGEEIVEKYSHLEIIESYCSRGKYAIVNLRIKAK
jgi:hypothetical protein